MRSTQVNCAYLERTPHDPEGGADDQSRCRRAAAGDDADRHPPGEALGLRRSDVTLPTAMIHVRGSFSDGQLGPTKTARSVRKVSSGR